MDSNVYKTSIKKAKTRHRDGGCEVVVLLDK